jgi:hypothetical protein
MKPVVFVLLVLVGSLILTNLPAPSYADSNLDTLLRIATQARDNINIQLSQLPTVPDEINQLYKQGSEETDALTQSVSQEDQASSKQHFLSAMKIFKEINDKISSFTPVVTNQQIPQIDTLQLGSEINRMQKLGDRLETIATKNNVEIDFTKFSETMQDARKSLDAGNADQVNKDLQTANHLLLDAHQLLADAAKKKTSDRAKDFTEKQIQRLSQVNATGLLQNVARSSAPPVTPVPVVTNGNQTGNIPDMIIQLKQLVSEGKIDEALKLIKLIEVLQNPRTSSQVPETEIPNATQPADVNNVNTPEIANPVNNSTTSTQTNLTTPNQIPPPPSTPPILPPSNVTSQTTPSTTHILPPSNVTSQTTPSTTHILPPSNVTSQTTPSTPPKTNSTQSNVTSQTTPSTPPKTNSTQSASSTKAQTSSTISLTINSVDLSGNQIRGIWIELHNPSDQVLKNGYAPISFSVSSGNQYVIHVSSWHNIAFNHWDNGSTDSHRTITLTHSVTLTAYYSTGSTTQSKTTHGDHEKHNNEGQD